MKLRTRQIIATVIAALVFSGAYLGLIKMTTPELTVGEKKINIVVTDRETKEVFNEDLDTDAELLGELIDEMNTEELILFILEGQADSEFGRFITDIGDVELEEGDFWVYDSENSQVCKDEGFCPGIDQLAIQDGDDFTFEVLLP